MRRRGPQPWLTNRSRALRSRHIAAELVLWRRLRNRQLGGFKFVRQEPIGPFFVDFVCRERNLVVEIDGGTHSSDEELESDATRDARLRAMGYQVVRVRNGDVYENLDVVLDAILAELQASGGDWSCG